MSMPQTPEELKAFNRQLIVDFRAHDSKLKGRRILLLTTTGARSGQPHTTPMTYVLDSDRVLVIASNAGAVRHPDWYVNLVANPAVTVELPDERRFRRGRSWPRARSTTASGRTLWRRCPSSPTTRRRSAARFPSSSWSALSKEIRSTCTMRSLRRLPDRLRVPTAQFRSTSSWREEDEDHIAETDKHHLIALMDQQDGVKAAIWHYDSRVRPALDCLVQSGAI